MARELRLSLATLHRDDYPATVVPGWPRTQRLR